MIADRQDRRRPNRSGFATFEIFVVSPIILAIGIAATLLIQWLASSSHWTTWIPAAILGIPFSIAYGFLVPLIIFGLTREYIRERRKTKR